jgi:hypothetical protein
MARSPQLTLLHANNESTNHSMPHNPSMCISRRSTTASNMRTMNKSPSQQDKSYKQRTIPSALPASTMMLVRSGGRSHQATKTGATSNDSSLQKNRVSRGSNETWKRFSMRTPTMLWCFVGTQYKKQKLQRTCGGTYASNRSVSISRKRERHATRQHRHVTMVVVWVLWRKPNTDAAQRTNKNGGSTNECVETKKQKINTEV